MKKITLLLLFSVLFLTSCVYAQTEIYRDTNVVVSQKHAPLYPFNVHGGDRNYLTVNGKTYGGVRGLPPCYLQIPELHSILFVTESGNEGQNVTFHVVNLETKKEIEIQSDEATFGGNIGAKRRTDDNYTDYVENAETNKLVLTTRYPDLKKSYYLDLLSKKVERVEQDHYDKNGKVIGHDAYIDGKLQ
jgi:hypothetical protein